MVMVNPLRIPLAPLLILSSIVAAFVVGARAAAPSSARAYATVASFATLQSASFETQSTSDSTSSLSTTIATTRRTRLGMAPRYDPFTQRWESTDPESDYDGAYGPIGSLIRAGPKPFIIRLINPDQYEQAVLKYMFNERVGRKEAQGNMDAYFENPNDWAYQKMIERNGGYKKDWANANTEPKQLVLTGVWAGIVVWFFNSLITDSLAGKYPTQNLFEVL